MTTKTRKASGKKRTPKSAIPEKIEIPMPVLRLQLGGPPPPAPSPFDTFGSRSAIYEAYLAGRCTDQEFHLSHRGEFDRQLQFLAFTNGRYWRQSDLTSVLKNPGELFYHLGVLLSQLRAGARDVGGIHG